MASTLSNLAYYYRFDTGDLSGNTLKNWANGNYSAICSSASVISNSNYYIGSSALNLNANLSQNVTISSATCFNSNFSISFWISSLSNKLIGTYSRRIIEYSNDSGVNNLFALLITSNSLRIYSTAGTNTDINYGVNINNGIWTHIIVSFVLSSKILRVFVNGSLLNQQTISNALAPATSGKLCIGSDTSSGGAAYFTGAIDDFRIYNYAISSQDDVNYLFYYPNYYKYINSTRNSTLLSSLSSNYYDLSNQNIIFDYEPRNVPPGTILLLLGDPIDTTSNKGNYTNSVTFASTNQSIFNTSYSSLYVVDSSAGSISIVNLFSGTINFLQNPSSITVENRYNINPGITSLAFDTTNTYYYVTNGSYVQQMNYTTNIFIQNINTDALTNIKYCITDSSNILYISHNTGINRINLSGTIPTTSTNVLTTTIGMSQMANSPVYPNELYAIDISNTKIYVISTISPYANYALTLPSSFMYSTAILTSLCFDKFGNLYVSTSKGTYAIYMIANYILDTYSANQTLTNTEIIIYAGIGGTTIGTTGYTGDGGTCYNALFKNISNIMMDSGNNMYICDSSNATVRKILNTVRKTNFLNTITDEMGIQSQYDISTLYSPTYSFTTNQASNYCIGNTSSFIDTEIKASNYNLIDNSGLLLYYRFNSMDISGLNLANYSTGYPVNDASLSAVGLVNSNDYVVDNSAFNNTASGNIKLNHSVLSAGTWPTTNGISVAFWVKSNSTGTSGRIMDFGNAATSPTNSLLISPNILDLFNNIVLSYTIISGGTASNYYTNFAINNNIWHHACISLTYDTSVNSIHNVYIDGSLYYTGTGIYPTSTTYTSCYIGKSNWVADPSFNGSIDDFRLYNRILSASEVSALYNLGTNIVSFVNLRSTGAIPVLTVSNLKLSYTVANDSIPIRNGIYNILGSSTGGSTAREMYAFDNNNSTYHSSQGARYTNGVYTDIVSTTFSDNTTVLGEWSQIQLPYMLKATSYTVVNTSSYATISIKSYVLAGSTDGLIWDYIDYVNMGTNAVLSFTINLNSYANTWTWTYKNLAQKYYNYFRFIGVSMTSTGANRYYLADLKLYGIGKYSTNLPITNIYDSYDYDTIPVLTSNTTVISGYTPSYLNGTYIASTSSEYSTGLYTAYKAFDYNTGTFWNSNGSYNASGVNYTGTVNTTFKITLGTTTTINGEWIQIQLPYSLSLRGYYLLPRNGFYTQAPKSWYLVGSNNGSTWYAIDYNTGYSPSSMSYTSDFGNSYTNYNYYSYFRLIIVTINGNQSPTINQLQLWGTAMAL